jgi:hypothetical protein
MMDMMLGKELMDKVRTGHAVQPPAGAPGFASTSLKPPAD